MKIVRGFIPAVDHFTSVPNEWARDNRLSYRARGILVALLSHREGWHSSVEAIAREGVEGRDAVRTAIHELEAVGYLIRERGRDEQRKYTGGTYLIKSPCESIDGFSASGKAMSDNPSHKKTNSKKTNEVNGASVDAPSRNVYPEDFETFWSHYPSRGKHPNPKKAAYSKWKTATKTTDPQVLITAVKAYASSELPEDRQMIPQAVTWLSQERWEQQDTTTPSDWLKDCWRRGDTASVTSRTGLIYGGVVWPDDIPTDPEQRAGIRLQQARRWIKRTMTESLGGCPVLSDLIRPTDPDAERVLIAHVLSLAVRDKSVLEVVPAQAFDNKVFSEVWRHARSLHDRGERVSPRAVLTEAGHDKNEHLASVLQGVTGQSVSAVQVGEARARVVEMARMRRLLDGVVTAYERAQYAEDYSEALHHVTEAVDGLEGTSTPKDVVSFADALTRWQERINDDTSTPRIFPTPWSGLNEVLSGGLHAGRSYVIGARPGEGRSMAGANLAQFAAEQGHSALIFSVEMDEHEVVSRALAAGARANYGQITKRLIDAPNYAKIDAYAAQSRSMPLRIVDRADISVDFVRSTCRSVKREHGLDVVFVDYLQLLSPTDSQATRERQIAHISRSLKILSRELDCAVVTACQLNRNTANEDRPPRKADLRESGSIEQDADVVVLLHHLMHAAHDGTKEHSGEVDLIVDKNRTGPRGSINQVWAAAQAAIR